MIFLAAMALVVAGCANPNAVPAHTAADDKAINYYKSLTPQQRIELIQKGAMPQAAKDAQIAKIKADNGLK